MTISAERQLVDSDMEWRYRGSCRGTDPDIFFPVRARGQAAIQARRAQRICRDCPVITICRDWALRTGQDCGIWGGLTEKQRRRILADRSPVHVAVTSPDRASRAA